MQLWSATCGLPSGSRCCSVVISVAMRRRNAGILTASVRPGGRRTRNELGAAIELSIRKPLRSAPQGSTTLCLPICRASSAHAGVSSHTCVRFVLSSMGSFLLRTRCCTQLVCPQGPVASVAADRPRASAQDITQCCICNSCLACRQLVALALHLSMVCWGGHRSRRELCMQCSELHLSSPGSAITYVSRLLYLTTGNFGQCQDCQHRHCTALQRTLAPQLCHFLTKSVSG